MVTVRLAKGLNQDEIPRNLTLGGVPISQGGIANDRSSALHEQNVLTHIVVVILKT